MADRIIKSDSGNDVVIQNNGGTRKIEVTDSGDVEVTGDFKATTVKATNLKANDGTAGLVVADSTGEVTSSGGLKSTNVKATNIKAHDGTAGLVIADSTGRVTFSENNPVITLGSNTVFPAGHIVQSVFNPTISGASNTNHFTSEGVAAQLDGQITITSGNGVLIYFCALLFLDRNTQDCGFLMKLREGLTTSGALITDHQERFSSQQDVLYSRSLWGFDASPASTTPDYCITLQRYTSGINFVEINDTSSQFLKAFLFEVKQ